MKQENYEQDVVGFHQVLQLKDDLPSVFDVQDGDPIHACYAVPDTEYVLMNVFGGAPLFIILGRDGTVDPVLNNRFRTVVETSDPPIQFNVHGFYELGRIVQALVS